MTASEILLQANCSTLSPLNSLDLGIVTKSETLFLYLNQKDTPSCCRVTECSSGQLL